MLRRTFTHQRGSKYSSGAWISVGVSSTEHLLHLDPRLWSHNYRPFVIIHSIIVQCINSVKFWDFAWIKYCPIQNGCNSISPLSRLGLQSYIIKIYAHIFKVKIWWQPIIFRLVSGIFVIFKKFKRIDYSRLYGVQIKQLRTRLR